MPSTPKTTFYSTTVTFGGSSIAAASASYTDSIELADTTTTADGGYKSVTPTLKDRKATVTTYVGSANSTLPTIGANGSLSWTGGGAAFPAYVADVSYGQAQVNGAIPVTITFQGNGN
jgi:hypothetical protein